MSVEFAINILLEQKFHDTYLILCFTKINAKILTAFSKKDFKENRMLFFQTLMGYVRKVIQQAPGKIEDGDKHPIRQCFELLEALLASTGLIASSIDGMSG